MGGYARISLHNVVNSTKSNFITYISFKPMWGTQQSPGFSDFPSFRILRVLRFWADFGPAPPVWGKAAFKDAFKISFKRSIDSCFGLRRRPVVASQEASRLAASDSCGTACISHILFCYIYIVWIVHRCIYIYTLTPTSVQNTECTCIMIKQSPYHLEQLPAQTKKEKPANPTCPKIYVDCNLAA